MDQKGWIYFRWLSCLSFAYYCGEESLRRNRVALITNKRVWNAVLGCSLKNNRIFSVCFQGKPLNITVIQVHATTNDAEEAEIDQFYKKLQHLLESTSKRDVLYIIEEWNAKVERYLENRHVWPWSTKWRRTKAKRVCHENTLVIANTLFQHPKDDSTHGHHQVVNTKMRLIMSFADKDGDTLKQGETRSGSDYS